VQNTPNVNQNVNTRFLHGYECVSNFAELNFT
jgi:hypothetical protein